MKIGIVAELKKNENRIAITPEIAKKMSDMGLKIFLESGAGEKSGFYDDDYKTAKVLSSAKEVYQKADIICKIWAPTDKEKNLLHENQIIIANFQALAYPENKKILEKPKATGFALDLLPRISRAQSMDILSSQSNLAGYKAVIEALSRLRKAVPLMMTSAGTIPAAKFLVLGVGVAGLQAIATAHRMGAQVFASDIRAETEEQVISLGAKFISPQEINTLLPSCDVIITTAFSAEGKAPKLIGHEQIMLTPKNAIFIDLAGEFGGNVEGAKNNETCFIAGREVYANSNLPSEIPFSASPLYAKNIFNFLSKIYIPQEDNLYFDFEDELINKTCVCLQGVLR